MNSQRRPLWPVLLIIALCWVPTSALSAGSPLEQVKETIDHVLGILKDPRIESKAMEAERREVLRRVLAPRFDFFEMARMALGSHWERQADRRKEFVSAFTGFMEKTYASRIEFLKDKQVIYTGQRVDNGFARVDTRVLPGNGDEIAVYYKLRMVEGEWKIYDLLIDNVSLMENYRAQFNRVLTNTSFDELLKKLQQKNSGAGG